MGDRLCLGLISEVFFDDDGGGRLGSRLKEAADRGAELAVLPELPLNRWCPAGREVAPEDAEDPRGPRHRRLAEAARDAGVAVLGGAIVRHPESGRRHNRALLIDRTGRLAATYDKLHLPSEPGYWESHHYDPGDGVPERIELSGFPLGAQICSDLNRPEGCHLLGAQGVAAILAPRATPLSSYERWQLVIRANAVTSCSYVVSVNRPGPEPGTEVGGPTLVAGPDGGVLLETTEPLVMFVLDRARVAAARKEYPGYMPVRADLYSRGWSALVESPNNPRREA